MADNKQPNIRTQSPNSGGSEVPMKGRSGLRIEAVSRECLGKPIILPKRGITFKELKKRHDQTGACYV